MRLVLDGRAIPPVQHCCARFRMIQSASLGYLKPSHFRRSHFRSETEQGPLRLRSGPLPPPQRKAGLFVPLRAGGPPCNFCCARGLPPRGIAVVPCFGFRHSLRYSNVVASVAIGANCSMMPSMHQRQRRHPGRKRGCPAILLDQKNERAVVTFYPENQHWLRESRFADYVVQKYIDGMEVTTSVYLSGFGQVHAVVSHSRLEVRSGEVSKAVTIDQPLLVEYARILAKNLALIGPFCFQTIAPNHRRPQIIEINARFGGGYPIAHQAGAHFTRYIIEQALGREPTPCGSCTVGLVMLRYDAAVYVEP
jgi:hypothetical protein